MQAARQVVVLAHHAAHGRIPALGLGVARVVEADRLGQRLHPAVVEEHAARGHVAQRGRLELAAVPLVGLAGVVGPRAQAQVGVPRVAVGRDLGVARHADGRVREVGEQRDAAVEAGAVVVAGEAVALVRVVVDREAARLGRRHRAAGLVAGIEVVAAAVRMEARVFQLERLQRPGGVVERGLVVERVLAEDGLERVGIGGLAQPRDHVGRAAVGHLDRVEQRNAGLLGQRGGAAVLRQAAARARGADAVGVVQHVGVRRRGLLVAQRRHGTHAGARHARAARLHGQAVGRGVRVREVVAARAGEAARRGERLVGEHLLAQPGERAQVVGLCRGGGERQRQRRAGARKGVTEEHGTESRNEHERAGRAATGPSIRAGTRARARVRRLTSAPRRWSGSHPGPPAAGWCGRPTASAGRTPESRRRGSSGAQSRSGCRRWTRTRAGSGCWPR